MTGGDGAFVGRAESGDAVVRGAARQRAPAEEGAPTGDATRTTPHAAPPARRGQHPITIHSFHLLLLFTQTGRNSGPR